jgi:hypothetical protein
MMAVATSTSYCPNIINEVLIANIAILMKIMSLGKNEILVVRMSIGGNPLSMNQNP